MLVQSLPRVCVRFHLHEQKCTQRTLFLCFAAGFGLTPCFGLFVTLELHVRTMHGAVVESNVNVRFSSKDGRTNQYINVVSKTQVLFVVQRKCLISNNVKTYTKIACCVPYLLCSTHSPPPLPPQTHTHTHTHAHTVIHIHQVIYKQSGQCSLRSG